MSLDLSRGGVLLHVFFCSCQAVCWELAQSVLLVCNSAEGKEEPWAARCGTWCSYGMWAYAEGKQKGKPASESAKGGMGEVLHYSGLKERKEVEKTEP